MAITPLGVIHLLGGAVVVAFVLWIAVSLLFFSVDFCGRATSSPFTPYNLAQAAHWMVSAAGVIALSSSMFLDYILSSYAGLAGP
jgi:hypothetical protein